MGLEMSQVREPAFDRAVALVLRIGAFVCFFIMLAGLLAGLFVSGRIPLAIERVGAKQAYLEVLGGASIERRPAGQFNAHASILLYS